MYVSNLQCLNVNQSIEVRRVVHGENVLQDLYPIYQEMQTMLAFRFEGNAAAQELFTHAAD
jgi:hypothetical protein